MAGLSPPEMGDPLNDDMDELMVSAMEDCTGVLRASTYPAAANDSNGNIPSVTTDGLPDELVDGFDRNAGRTWIYPTNKEVRDYQYNIVRKALIQNTLVCLPTGLGKTFIAAVVMYNFYRWFPRGKVIFMAPSKPLVTQQMEACYEVMGIPQAHMSEMTGSLAPNLRQAAWHDKRVFFLTPQIISNDINREICPASLVCCLVFDEAHKALGNHAYVQVIRELSNHSRGNFRVLALSATPGSNYSQVRHVVQNLLIANVEIRNEDSLDIVPYTHLRLVEKVVVPLSDELLEAKNCFLNVVSVYVDRLHHRGCLSRRNPDQLSKFFCLKERERFRQKPPDAISRLQFGAVEGDFAMVISLFHALDLLQFYGLLSFYTYWQEVLHGDKGQPRTRYELRYNVTFCRLMDGLERKFGNIKQNQDPSTSDSPKIKFDGYSHPKFEKLEEIVLEHFAGADSTEDEDTLKTRIIIFTQYRESVREIEAVLNRHRPRVRPVVLIGQGQGSGGSNLQRAGGLKQKAQVQVMMKFRLGECNVLVSTCIGEEGLDIGDVDLIICFDAQKSPIRLIQRMGRTGRKRNGRVVVLLTKGKEENAHNQGQYNSKAVKRALSCPSASYELYENNPRMIPADLEPVCHKMYLSCETFVHGKRTKKIVESASKSRKKQMPKLPHDDAFVIDVNQSRLTSYLEVSNKKTVTGSRKPGRRLKQIETLALSSDDDEFILEAPPLQKKLPVDLSLSSKDICDEQSNLRPDSTAIDMLTDGEESLDLGPGNDFFTVLQKQNDSEDVSDLSKSKNKAEYAKELHGICQNVIHLSVKTPPMPSEFDALDTIEVEFLSVFGSEESILMKPDFNETSFFKTPKSVSFQRAVVSTPQVQAAVPSKLKNESLYSMTQLLGMIDEDSMDQNSHGISTPDQKNSCVQRNSLSKVDADFGSVWDSDDDLLSAMQMIPPSPTETRTEAKSNNLKYEMANEALCRMEIIPPSPKRTPSFTRLFSRNTSSLVSNTSQLKNIDVRPNSVAVAGVASPVAPPLSSPSSEESIIVRKGALKKLPRSRRLILEDWESDVKTTKHSNSKVSMPLSREFLDAEAIVDGDSICVSSDESSNGLSSFDASFIDDDAKQDHGCNATMYLNSVKSPRCRPGAFKLITAVNHAQTHDRMDIYSQSVSSEESEYQQDSFCVPNDESEDQSPKHPKRRRIVMVHQDSTSEEEIDLQSSIQGNPVS